MKETSGVFSTLEGLWTTGMDMGTPGKPSKCTRNTCWVYMIKPWNTTHKKAGDRSNRDDCLKGGGNVIITPFYNLLSITFLFRGIAGIYRSSLIKGLVPLWLVHSLVSQLGYITIPDPNLCTHDSLWLTLNGHMTHLLLWHSIIFYLFPFTLLVTVTRHSFILVYKNPFICS